MKTIRVLSIFGTRPEAVKMAPVVKELKETEGVDARVCVTAQHREMLDQVLNLFKIVPDIDLNLMRPGQSLAEISAAIFSRLDPVLANLKPDWVLIQGDTTTVMTASLVAFYRKILVGHVEAGLRTRDKWRPFPEEINRRVAGVVADLHFAPTKWARENLLQEGIPEAKIAVTGNTVIDAIHMISNFPTTPQVRELFAQMGIPDEYPADKHSTKPSLILVTAHRRENFGEPIENICQALRQLASVYQDEIRIIYPVHLNPNVQGPVYRLLSGIPNIYLLPPLDYLPLVQIMKRATLILTDSGGIQEEAPSFGVPVLVLREVTERPEGIQAGTVKLVGTNTTKILNEARNLLDDPEAYMRMAKAVNPYGDGHAAKRIIRSILDYPPRGD